MNKNFAKVIASVTVCALGALSMKYSNGQTDVGWALLGLFLCLIWC